MNLLSAKIFHVDVDIFRLEEVDEDALQKVSGSGLEHDQTIT